MRVSRMVLICVGGLLSGNAIANGAKSMDIDPLIGSWQSDKAASVKALQQAQVDPKQIDKMAFLFGKMVVEITPTTYQTRLYGSVDSFGYRVVAVNGDCRTLQFDGNNADSTVELCVKDGRLLVPAYQGVHEVFKRL